jgi:hypothetical protein
LVLPGQDYNQGARTFLLAAQEGNSAMPGCYLSTAGSSLEAGDGLLVSVYALYSVGAIIAQAGGTVNLWQEAVSVLECM